MPDAPGCGPKPNYTPTPYGNWMCTKTGWVWIEAYGRISQFIMAMAMDMTGAKRGK